MNDQALIQSLCDDLHPVRPHRFEQQLTSGLVLGGAVSLMALVATFGIQPGLTESAGFIPLFLKISYAASLATVALVATVGLARPGSPVKSRRGAVAAIVVLLGVVALSEFALELDAQAAHLWLGASWQSCSLRIAALALPLTAGIGWAVRKQAPVRLREAGATIGLAAGSIAAGIYALACTEASAGFVLAWYSIGIALSTGLGALFGPRLLRW
jgi:hypothetical protein